MIREKKKYFAQYKKLLLQMFPTLCNGAKIKRYIKNLAAIVSLVCISRPKSTLQFNFDEENYIK